MSRKTQPIFSADWIPQYDNKGNVVCYAVPQEFAEAIRAHSAPRESGRPVLYPDDNRVLDFIDAYIAKCPGRTVSGAVDEYLKNNECLALSVEAFKYRMRAKMRKRAAER